MMQRFLGEKHRVSQDALFCLTKVDGQQQLIIYFLNSAECSTFKEKKKDNV